MPTLDENLRHWQSTYGWPDGGEEWSQVWGDSATQWRGSILPRIGRLLPARRGLEIGSGHGRWSRWLRPLCERLILIDLAERCVEACRRRFEGDAGVDCRLSDGRSLPGVGAGELDFVFSFDSLVHAEGDVLEAYAGELARVLAPEGSAFLHHSNFGAVLASRPGSENRHWRGESASAEGFAGACERVGLACVRQEIVDWGGVEDCDGFSLVVRAGSSLDRDRQVRRNPYFMGEAQSVRLRAELWEEREAGSPGSGRPASEGPPSGSPPRD
jgi:SAM-dependent methyltransferase